MAALTIPEPRPIGLNGSAVRRCLTFAHACEDGYILLRSASQAGRRGFESHRPLLSLFSEGTFARATAVARVCCMRRTSARSDATGTREAVFAPSGVAMFHETSSTIKH